MTHEFVARGLAAMCLCTATGWAVAQEGESFCTAPGVTIVEDASGDGGVGIIDGASVPVDALDLLSLQVAQPAQDDGVIRVVFTLKVASLAIVPPQAAWFTSFKTPDGQLRGVRMITDQAGAASFQSYVVAPSDTDGSTSGQLADSIGPVEDSSSFSADGTITIVAKASDLRIRNAGDEIKQFNAGTVLTVGNPDVGSASLSADGAPDDLSRRGSVTISANGECGSGSKSLVERMGGALNFALLLPLLGIAALRRRK